MIAVKMRQKENGTRWIRACGMKTVNREIGAGHAVRKEVLAWGARRRPRDARGRGGLGGSRDWNGRFVGARSFARGLGCAVTGFEDCPDTTLLFNLGVVFDGCGGYSGCRIRRSISAKGGEFGENLLAGA